MKRGKSNMTLFGVHCLRDFSQEDASPALPVVIDALKTEDSKIRLEALQTLRAIDRDAKSSRAVAAILSDQDINVRNHAFGLLGSKFGPKAKEAVPELLKISKRATDPRDRVNAIDALHSIRPNVEELLPVLREALKAKEREIRVHAQSAIGQLGETGKDAVPDLIAAIKNAEDLHELGTIVDALGNIGPAAKPALPAINEAIRTASKNLQGRGGIGGSPFGPRILQALEKIDK
jgi:HEAT repeat protein